jgi:hypothetical protein
MRMTIEESDRILARLKPPPYDIDGWMIGFNEQSYHESDNSYERFTGKAVRVGPWPDRYRWSDCLPRYARVLLFGVAQIDG